MNLVFGKHLFPSRFCPIQTRWNKIPRFVATIDAPPSGRVANWTGAVKPNGGIKKTIMQNEQKTGTVIQQWLNKAEIARHYNCSVRHINTLMNRRVLPFLKIGRFVRFDATACDQVMKGYETKTVLTW